MIYLNPHYRLEAKQLPARRDTRDVERGPPTRGEDTSANRVPSLEPRALGPEPGSETFGWRSRLRLCVHVAMKLGVTETDAEDVAREAVLRLVSQRVRIEHPNAWLSVVVRRLVYRRQARRATRARTHAELARDGAPTYSPTASWQADIDTTRTLAYLTPATRQLLELVLVGYTHREIAAALGCRTHQVGPRIQRALGTARRRLAKDHS